MTGPVRVFEQVPPHAVRDGVLSPDDLAGLLAFTLAGEAEFVPAKLGRIGIDEQFRAARVLPRRLFEPWRARIETHFAALVPQLTSDLGMPAFNVSRFELQLVRHNDGDFYRTHVDTRMGTHDDEDRRMLSMVYYFHAEPKAFSEGALRLFALASEAIYEDIAPEQNRLVAFPSWIPHEVRPVACPSGRFVDSRFAINCWARTPRTPPKP